MYPTGGEEEISFDEFRNNYLAGASLAAQLAKESQVAAKLDSVVKGKNYDEIE